jgi:hypothetical protein
LPQLRLGPGCAEDCTLVLPGHGAGAAETDQSLIAELETAIAGVRAGRIASPRNCPAARWWHPTNAQKMAEEATEVVIEAVRGEEAHSALSI